MAEATTDKGIPENVAAQVSSERWGGLTRLVFPTSFTNITTRVRVLTNNPKRVWFAISNYGPGEAYFGYNDPTFLNINMILGFRGATVIMSVDEDGEIVAQDWWVRSGSIALAVAVWEVERV